MKDTIVSLLQQRMDKCTSEQFWAVGAITAFNGVLVTQARAVASTSLRWVLVGAVVMATAYAVYYIINRHKSYYLNRGALAELLQDAEQCPEFLKKVPNPQDARTWTGCAFYVLWVIGMGTFGILSLMS